MLKHYQWVNKHAMSRQMRLKHTPWHRQSSVNHCLHVDANNGFHNFPSSFGIQLSIHWMITRWWALILGVPHEFYLFIFPPFYEQNQKECFLLKILMFHLSKIPKNKRVMTEINWKFITFPIFSDRMAAILFLISKIEFFLIFLSALLKTQ